MSRYYHTDWVPEDELRFRVDGLNMDAVYESLVRQIAGGRCKRILVRAYRLPWSAMKRGGSWKSRLLRWRGRCGKRSNSTDGWKSTQS